ncbi:MAG TPA: Cof-type HAD-IIB family hydrolase [Jiangellaceae bacterium]|nr:Cof-type HAD-IIB family hydrolase [Jiangellaceae bacterium]
MIFRLIATDLDGTVLRSDGSVSERTVAALRAAESSGSMVVVATGRPPRWMRPVADALGHTGLAVCSNGAVVYDLHTDEVLEHTPISRDVVLAVAAAVRAAVREVTFAIETRDAGFGREASYPVAPDVDLEPDGMRVGSLDELVSDDVIKLLVRHADLDPGGLLAAAREVAGELAELTYSSRSGLLEISAIGVTKAASLARIADRQGIRAEDAVAFGDMPNDLPMLAWAGRGYAMANAHPDVLDAAEHLAPSNDDDGVAQIVENLLADLR